MMSLQFDVPDFGVMYLPNSCDLDLDHLRDVGAGM